MIKFVTISLQSKTIFYKFLVCYLDGQLFHLSHNVIATQKNTSIKIVCHSDRPSKWALKSIEGAFQTVEPSVDSEFFIKSSDGMYENVLMLTVFKYDFTHYYCIPKEEMQHVLLYDRLTVLLLPENVGSYEITRRKSASFNVLSKL